MLPIIQNAEEVTMTSFDFLNNIINPARELFGEKPVANDKFLKKVVDEVGFTENEKMSFTQEGHFKPTSYFILNFDHMTLVGMRESKGVRKSILNKLKELSEPKAPQLPQTFAEALQLAADQAKLIEQQSEKIAIDKPKVEFVDKLVDKSNLMNATTIAQKHGKSAIWLNKILKEHDVYSKAIKRGKVFRQWFIQKKFGEMKQTEMGYSQAMFTNAGEIWINELLIAHGYV